MWSSCKLYNDSLFRKCQIEDIKLHPEFVDLAMVKVSEDIDFKTYRPICLPDPGRDRTNK